MPPRFSRTNNFAAYNIRHAGERHERRFDKSLFFQDLGYTPRPDQLQVHMDTAKIRVLACGVRWGKSKLSAMEALSAAISAKERSFGWVVAPSYALSEKVFREILFQARYRLKDFIIDSSDSKMKLHLRNMGGYVSEIWGKSTDNPDSLLGEGLNWVVVDEAPRIKQVVWDSYLSQRLLDKDGWALLIGSPTGRNWFYYQYQRGKDPLEKGRVSSYSFPTMNNPLISKELLETAKKELPEDAYRQEILAEFLTSGGTVFRNIEACIERGTVLPVPPKGNSTYVMGVDLAKYRDYTVIVVIDQKGRVCGFDRFNQIDWSVQKQRIKQWSKQYNNAAILMDSTGVGDAIYEDMVGAGAPITPYTFTESSKKALIDNLVVVIENQQITLPNVPELLNELHSFSYTLTGAGRLQRSAPSGLHDDCVIALALAVWQMGRRINSDMFGELRETEAFSAWQ